MVNFKDIPDADIKGIQAPALVINGFTDVVLPEHALELARTLPHAQLAILPGGHGDYIGEICAPNNGGSLPSITTALIESFLTQ
jgi:pimeloyl-ACP methyl ester carboxylesterase